MTTGNNNYKTVREPVGVLGAGVEGRAVINYLLSHGVSDITALDANNVDDLPSEVKKNFGEQYTKDLDRFATIFKSPGFRPDLPSLKDAWKKGTKVTSTLSYFMENCPCQVVGVTGTVGKGTTSSLIAEMLNAAGFKTHLGGNIGKSPLEFLDEVKPEHKVVLEISSFQAMDVSCSPNVAVILKTTSEHLDWHVDTEEYRTAKAQLLAHQVSTDIVIYNADAPGSVEIAKRSLAEKRGFSLENKSFKNGLSLTCDNSFLFSKDGVSQPLLIDTAAVKLPGKFNLENVAAGIMAAFACGGDEAAVCNVAENFVSLPHRLEFVCEGGGVRYYNDSYATRPDACIAALSAFDGPLSIILGGSEKNADFNELVRVLFAKTNLQHVSLIGATALRLAKMFESDASFSHNICTTFEEAVNTASASLDNGGVVLLAPACASFGMFKNYKVRGEQFRQIARKKAVSGV